jgi:hypothetical protein
MAPNKDPVLPVVVRNIDELEKSLPKRGSKLLIHLTRAQWSGMSKGIKFRAAPLKDAIAFRYTPLADGTGGIGDVQCMPGECENCSVRWGRNPDGSVGLQCKCARDPRCIHLGGAACSLTLRRAGLRWELICSGSGCAGTCRLVASRQRVGDRFTYVLACKCQNG